MASDTLPPPPSGKGRIREKVAIKPGFHMADWLRMCDGILEKKSGQLLRVSLEELSKHNTQTDCWTAYNKKVYDISQYFDYHPGGVTILMQGAGRDCTSLVQKYHRWVNVESLLAAFHIGNLMEESEAIPEDGDSILPESEVLEERGPPVDVPIPITKSTSISTEISAKALMLLSLDSSEIPDDDT